VLDSSLRRICVADAEKVDMSLRVGNCGVAVAVRSIGRCVSGMTRGATRETMICYHAVHAPVACSMLTRRVWSAIRQIYVQWSVTRRLRWINRPFNSCYAAQLFVWVTVVVLYDWTSLYNLTGVSSLRRLR